MELASWWMNLTHRQLCFLVCFLTLVKEDGIYLIEWWFGLKHAVGFLASASLARITLAWVSFQKKPYLLHVMLDNMNLESCQNVPEELS